MNIDSIEVLLDYGFSLAYRIKEVTADDSPGGKKVTFPEIVGSLNLLFKIPSLIVQAPLAYEQWKDVDEEEALVLKEKFALKFDIADDKREEAVEEVWGILVRIGRVIALMEKPKP